MRNQKNTGRSFNSKGYYIALILCAAAIGISGYLYYNNNQPDTSLAAPTLGVGDPDGNDVPVISPDPTKKPDDPIDPTKAPQKALKTGMPLSGQTVMEMS